MAHPIVWLPQAAEDLQEISDYIGQHSPAYADGMIERILDAVERLEQFPLMGHRVLDVRVKGIELRELAAPPYRIVYRVHDEHVVVLAIIHGARILRKAMRGRRLS
jgi:addiction module RelE/StbE family toxin